MVRETHMNVYRFEVGILLCRGMRDYMEQLKWRGFRIDWYEGKGWLSRTWMLKGQDSDIAFVKVLEYAESIQGGKCE
jgi:hypothetical protein